MRQLVTKVSHNKFSDKYVSELKYNPVSVCPICKAKISPAEISAMTYSKNSATNMACILNFCTGCHSPFISTYRIVADGSGYATEIEYLESAPNKFAKQVFDDKIRSLSPQFDKIYNQALAAESSDLDEIAGLGFRKSLEFLIKDYAMHEYPDEAERIKAKPLIQCIRDYIDDGRITTLAERSTWIGNDEAHYVRKQQDRDVSDMKSFIQAIVYFIGMVLITEDAASITPKK